ncbi:unnamed protein product [Anisakis simplex]|uniref:GDNF domain-containing protein n=1 Tax=Anisakis simplex TaxID=6269 RepID=A0A0M3KHD5_ANISI|nr:unnamed protein product [Anisakis simplex]
MCERYHGQADCLKMESECTKQLNAPLPQNSRKAYKMYQHVAKCVLAQDLWSRCIININAYRCAKLRDKCKIFAGEGRISFGARKLDIFSPKVSECMYNQVEFTVEH